MVLSGNITSAVDNGTDPIINLVAGRDVFDNGAPYSSQFPWGNGGTTLPIQNRPIFAVSNAFTNYLSVAANGNFGISTNNPQSKLHNVGTVRFESLPLSDRRGKCGLIIDQLTGEVFSDCSNIIAKNDDSKNTRPITNALNIVQNINTFESIGNDKKSAFIETENLEKNTQNQFKEYEQLIPYLLESIKELNTKIEDLERQINSKNSSTTSNNNLSVKVYPNPVKDNFNIYFDKTEDTNYQVKVYDNSGKLLINKIEIPLNQKLSLNVSNLSSGIYFYEISNNSKYQIKKGKLIKE